MRRTPSGRGRSVALCALASLGASLLITQAHAGEPEPLRMSFRATSDALPSGMFDPATRQNRASLLRIADILRPELAGRPVDFVWVVHGDPGCQRTSCLPRARAMARLQAIMGELTAAGIELPTGDLSWTYNPTSNLVDVVELTARARDTTSDSTCPARVTHIDPALPPDVRGRPVRIVLTDITTSRPVSAHAATQVQIMPATGAGWEDLYVLFAPEGQSPAALSDPTVRARLEAHLQRPDASPVLVASMSRATASSLTRTLIAVATPPAGAGMAAGRGIAAAGTLPRPKSAGEPLGVASATAPYDATVLTLKSRYEALAQSNSMDAFCVFGAPRSLLGSSQD